MSKQIKRKAKKTKKNIVAIIPIYCTWCNACVIGLLLLMGVSMLGGFDWLYMGENVTDIVDDDATTTIPPDQEPDALYKLAIQIYSWTHEPGYVAEDMTFEIWKLSDYSGVGSGVWYGDLYLSMWGSPWTYSSESEHFTYGTDVAIDMFITPNNHRLTTGDWLSTYVGAPQSRYAVYQNGIHCLDIDLKWVVI